MDADIASEAAELVKKRILQQVASSVLAQANQVPLLALRLLRGD
jgi:flagellin